MKLKEKFTNPITYHYNDSGTLYNWNTSHGQDLAKAFMLASKKPDLMKIFLDDLLSKNELEQCDSRLYTAYLLSLGTPYDFIQKMTGQSYTTIARIAKKLCHKNGGYFSVIQEMYPTKMRHLDF